MVFNAPCHFLLGLFDFRVVSIIEHLEKVGVDLEVILMSFKVIISSVVLLSDLVEPFS
jgi:hypothetical protein